MERNSILCGLLLVLVLHGGGAVLLYRSGLKYLYPPADDNSFVMEFEEEEEVEEDEEQETVYDEVEPSGERVDLTAPVKQVQRSEPVEKEPELDPRASFPGMSRKKDTVVVVPDGVERVSDGIGGGVPDGNSAEGRIEGKPNAKVPGRNVKGALPRPEYRGQERGTVVVSVLVNQYGKVTSATPGAEGTTVNDSKLWAAARNAAMGTRFEMKVDAPAEQAGTITYIFKLK